MKSTSNFKRPDKKTELRNFNFFYFIVISVLVHISLLGLLHLSTYFDGFLNHAKNKHDIVEIYFINEENKPPASSIVASDTMMANDKLAKDSRFLSERNNTVKKETKAKTGDKFHNAAKATAVAKNQTKNQNKSQTEKSKQVDQPILFANGFDAYASLNKKKAAEIPKQKTKSGNKDIADNFATNATDSMTNDNLAKIEDDLMTRLNTKEYKYYGYYNRIKTQLNQWWVPKVQQKFTRMLSQGRTIASEENKITKLIIILNDSGHLVKVQVLAESGIKDLDDAAIEAFRSAAPFPNPPKGMIDSDGTVKIRWDCVVES